MRYDIYIYIYIIRRLKVKLLCKKYSVYDQASSAEEMFLFYVWDGLFSDFGQISDHSG